MAVIAYQMLCEQLKQQPHRWLVTGAAGFIGSHLVETLLRLNQHVVAVDNFSTGHRHNIDLLLLGVSESQRQRFELQEGDIRDLDFCQTAMSNIDFVLHQAALGSVPRSIQHPLDTHAVNVNGFLNVLLAANQARVKRFVYASSSSVYGDAPQLPKQEIHTGQLLSPYAVSKMTNELYASVFGRCYGLETVGLRYFNVFGARQDPNGPYAAVIPLWVKQLLADQPITIFGDGETSRDFCFIDNVVQANLLGACTQNANAVGRVYNVAVGEQASLNQLLDHLKSLLGKPSAVAHYAEFRPGDIRHSLADIGRACEYLGYQPTHTLYEGLEMALPWYQK